MKKNAPFLVLLPLLLVFGLLLAELSSFTGPSSTSPLSACAEEVEECFEEEVEDLGSETFSAATGCCLLCSAESVEFPQYIGRVINDRTSLSISRRCSLGWKMPLRI